MLISGFAPSAKRHFQRDINASACAFTNTAEDWFLFIGRAALAYANPHASWFRLRLSGVYVDADLAYTDFFVGTRCTSRAVLLPSITSICFPNTAEDLFPYLPTKITRCILAFRFKVSPLTRFVSKSSCVLVQDHNVKGRLKALLLLPVLLCHYRLGHTLKRHGIHIKRIGFLLLCWLCLLLFFRLQCKTKILLTF